MEFKTRIVSSLEKVFNDEPLKAEMLRTATALRGEIFAFQVAYWCDLKIQVAVSVESDLGDAVSIREVALAPSEFPASDPSDPDSLLRNTPGLYPDPLMPIKAPVKLPPKQWRALWVTVRVPENAEPGKHQFKFNFKNVPAAPELEPDEFTESFELEILPVTLPEQKLLHTEWFHTDCIFSYYNVPCWSEEHWKLTEQFIVNATDHGVTMILTPLWTPPLDTAVGGERPTVQLLDIEKQGDKFIFDFSKLDRWIDMCLKNGVKQLEMAHPFSQWGAKTAPKIVVRENGEDVKMFGWHVEATSELYVSFLRQLYPQLLEFLKNKGVIDICFFHVSDEPNKNNIDSYRKAAAVINELLGDEHTVIDALSDITFYKEGIVKNPIPCTNHIEPFVENGVKPLMTYYCISQQDKMSNRFFNFPSARNRIIGALLFKYDIYAFLHWGFNFWYSQYSIKQDLNPFYNTDADRGFCSGDAFLVYPGEDGPVDSLRSEVFREGLQDLRALRLLEDKIGREAAVGFLQEGLGYELKMTDFPKSAAWLLDFRNRLNRKLAELA
jgi:hypothetical protein